VRARGPKVLKDGFLLAPCFFQGVREDSKARRVKSAVNRMTAFVGQPGQLSGQPALPGLDLVPVAVVAGEGLSSDCVTVGALFDPPALAVAVRTTDFLKRVAEDLSQELDLALRRNKRVDALDDLVIENERYTATGELRRHPVGSLVVRQSWFTTRVPHVRRQVLLRDVALDEQLGGLHGLPALLPVEIAPQTAAPSHRKQP
jgi:hypothetical protein